MMSNMSACSRDTPRLPRSRSRRALLRALCAAGVMTTSRRASAGGAGELFPDGATMLVAGPQGGRLDQWSGLLAPALARGLPAGIVPRRQTAGGADGVTGANQFEARVAPDGQTVLLLPGEAALAWLTGDPRARFDVARWVPVLSGISSGVVISRVPVAQLPTGGKLRIAAGGPVGPDLAALLALALLGIDAMPLFNLQDPDAATAALDSGAVDAVFLRGENAPRRVLALASSGVTPVFSLGVPDESGAFARDPLFLETPTVPELLRARGAAPAPALFAAWRATAAAAQMDFSVVLPQLAPAAIVSLWRRAAAQSVSAPELQAAATDGVRAVAAPASNMPIIAADADALVELRRWLASRFNWQPA
jgi:hypothetical protein